MLLLRSRWMFADQILWILPSTLVSTSFHGCFQLRITSDCVKTIWRGSPIKTFHIPPFCLCIASLIASAHSSWVLVRSIFAFFRHSISDNIRDKRSFRSVAEKIWENCEPSNFPFIPCYVSWAEWNGAQAQRGRSVTKWSEEVQKSNLNYIGQCTPSEKINQ